MRRLRPEDRAAELALTAVPAGTAVLQLCHPDWRGIRSSAEAFGAPVVALRDLTTAVRHLTGLAAAGTGRLVIQGWPPGARSLAEAAQRAGLLVAAVSHASPAQYGADAGEVEAVAEMLDLAAAGVLDRVGFVKPGMAETFAALGRSALPLRNRLPNLPSVDPLDLGPGDHVGIFLFPYWRKNVTTQVLAAALLGATAHVMHRPAVPLPQASVVAHGELPPPRFYPLLASVGLNLHVTLSECHPMLPMESYLLGVPCLVSPTAALFADDPGLRALTSVVEVDDPRRIAEAGRALRHAAGEVVPRAVAALRRADTEAAALWEAFVA